VLWLLDLDGVIWLGDQSIPGSADAVTRLRQQGHTVAFVTNNSFSTVHDYVDKLARCGVPADAGDLLTSAMAAAGLLQPGDTALIAGGPGIVEALSARRVAIVDRAPASAVVVGWHTSFDYQGLTRAFRAVHGGARLIGTNDDATYPTPEGLLPGGGSILAAVAFAGGVTPTVAGKPYRPMADLARDRFGPLLADAVFVGDRPDTDGRMAAELGVRFGLVLTGVTPEASPLDPPPAFVAPDLAALVGQLLA
jgi:HAD superfamily hydrolase (TIGR01450 family)